MPDSLMTPALPDSGMLDTIALFRALGIVETVKRSHKITGDAAGTFKAHILAHKFLRGFGFLEQTRFH